MSTTATLLEATSAALDLLQIATNATEAFSTLTRIIAQANAEGRDLNAADWEALDAANSAADAAVVAAIAQARGK